MSNAILELASVLWSNDANMTSRSTLGLIQREYEVAETGSRVATSTLPGLVSILFLPLHSMFPFRKGQNLKKRVLRVVTLANTTNCRNNEGIELSENSALMGGQLTRPMS